MPSDFDATQSHSLGMRLVSGAVTRELGGSMEVVNDGGAKFIIRFKGRSEHKYVDIYFQVLNFARNRIFLKNPISEIPENLCSGTYISQLRAQSVQAAFPREAWEREF